MMDRLKRLRLLGEAVDQVLRLDARVAGDVVDRLFRVERRALAADHLQGVDHVSPELQHAELEDNEQADGERNSGGVGQRVTKCVDIGGGRNIKNKKKNK